MNNPSPPPAERAADLPVRSIVGGPHDALFKDRPAHHLPWSSTDGERYSNADVDRSLRDGGAQVLRHGDGKTGFTPLTRDVVARAQGFPNGF